MYYYFLYLQKSAMNKKLLQVVQKETKDSLIKRNIIRHYIENGNSTLTELSQSVDLSIPTTTRFIADMTEEGYIEDFGKLETAEGRHPNLYGLSADAAYFVGVDIKQFGINIGLSNFRGEIINLKMGVPYVFENTQESFNQVCGIISSFIAEQNISKDKILNVNLNVSGRVNPTTGYSYSIFYFDENIPLAEKFSQELGCSATIDNDTRAMTYGEFLSGHITDERNIIFVNFSWGIAIGIIIDGKVYTGKSGFSGEFGHVKTFDNEILCHCGKKGCLETEISGLYLHRRLKELVAEGAVSLLSERINNGENLTLDDIIDAVNKEDVLCIELIEELGQKLGEQLAGIINIFNPDAVIIGGVLSETENYLMQPIKTAIRRYSLNLVNRDTKMIVSKFKDKAGVIGACLLARSRVFD